MKQNCEDYGIRRFFNYKESHKFKNKLYDWQEKEINNFFKNVSGYKPWHFHIIIKFVENELTNYLERFYKLRQCTKHTLEYYQLCYGEKRGKVEYNNFKNKAIKNHANKEDFWIAKGYSEEESKKLSENFQKENIKKAHKKIRGSKGKYTCRSKKYWMRQGYSESEAKNLVKDIQATNTVEQYIKKHGTEHGEKLFKKRNLIWGEKMESEMKSRGLWKKFNTQNLKSYEEYCYIIKSLTEKNYKAYKEIINPLDLPRGIELFELDHKISKLYGFINDIEPEIISHPRNLQMFWWKENRKKYSSCSIDLKELLEDIKNFNP